MLSFYLSAANKLAEDLISLTKWEIELIREARHDEIFQQSQTKEELVASFERHKTLIDAQIVKLVQDNPGSDLQTLLTDEQQADLQRMRALLSELKEHNLRLGRMIMAVNEFYTSLLARLVPMESTGYGSLVPKMRSTLQVRV